MRARTHHPRAGPARGRRGGIDISGNLISKARQTEQDEPLGIRYIHADVTEPEVLGDGGFDVAVCNFGLFDIDDLRGAGSLLHQANTASKITR